MNSSDVVIVGAGLVGSAVAYGLARQGLSVTLLDEGDQAFRASRGNFGLVWVQGKGIGCSPYAKWSLGSAGLWSGLAQDLLEETGTDVALRQGAGIHLCLSDDELTQRQERLAWLRAEVGDSYGFEMLDYKALKALVPAIGPTVAGASYTTMDGHVNPLKLLHALHQACASRKIAVHSNAGVERIERSGGIFKIHSRAGTWQAPKVVLAAGLANRQLAEQVGLYVPVAPNRGQVLITERVAPILPYPTNYVRQTDEGGIQIGDSQEDAGFDDFTSSPVLSTIAARAVRCFPMLANVRLVRTWAALRVMSPDGFPIYQESGAMPGAFVVTCHSGVTLAAQHAFVIAPWISGQGLPDAIKPFSSARFARTAHTETENTYGH